MKYGGLQCQAFVPGQEEPQPDPWSKIQQARIAAMQAELARRAASSSTRAVKERARKKAQASRKKAEKKAAAAAAAGGGKAGDTAGAQASAAASAAPAAAAAPATAAGPVDPAAWAVAEKVAAALKEILENEYGMQEHPPVILRPVQMGARRLELFVARETVAEKIGNSKLRGALVECEDTEAAVRRLARVLNERAAPNDYHPLKTAFKAVPAEVGFDLFE